MVMIRSVLGLFWSFFGPFGSVFTFILTAGNKTAGLLGATQVVKKALVLM